MVVVTVHPDPGVFGEAWIGTRTWMAWHEGTRCLPRKVSLNQLLRACVRFWVFV